MWSGSGSFSNLTFTQFSDIILAFNSWVATQHGMGSVVVFSGDIIPL